MRSFQEYSPRRDMGLHRIPVLIPFLTAAERTLGGDERIPASDGDPGVGNDDDPRKPIDITALL